MKTEVKKKSAILTILFTFSVLMWVSSISTAEEPFTGKVYLQGTNRGVLLFIQKNNKIQKDNKTIMKHTYTTPEGKMAAVEEVAYVNDTLDSYTVDLAYGNCGCVLNRKGQKVTFGFTRGDSSKKGTADYTNDIVMGPTLNDYVKTKWSRLIKGEKVYFMLPAMSLQRMAKFYLEKNPQSPYARPGVMVVKMNISNLIFRAFVDPVDLVYDMETKRIVEIHGKSLLQRKVGDKIENPVVDIYYQYGR